MGLPVLRTLSFMYVLPPAPRCSDWASSSLISPSRINLPRNCGRVGLRIVLFEACSAFTRVAARTLSPSPIKCDSYTEGFSHFVTSMTAPVASGWSVRRVGLAPTGKRRLVTAHRQRGHCGSGRRTSPPGEVLKRRMQLILSCLCLPPQRNV